MEKDHEVKTHRRRVSVMSVFYHVSIDPLHNGHFLPRIPSCRHKEHEDDCTKRVSVGRTIEDCLTAIPNGGGEFDRLNLFLRGYYRVFRIDTEKLQIPTDLIITSDELYEKDLVRDSGETGEHWILTEFHVPEEDTFLIHVTNWDESPFDVLPYSIFQIAEDQYDGDYLEAYEDIYQEYVPCSVRIENLSYDTVHKQRGDSFLLYYWEEKEKEELLNYLLNHLHVDKKIEDVGEGLLFSLYQSEDLTNLFLFHSEIAQYFNSSL